MSATQNPVLTVDGWLVPDIDRPQALWSDFTGTALVGPSGDAFSLTRANTVVALGDSRMAYMYADAEQRMLAAMHFLPQWNARNNRPVQLLGAFGDPGDRTDQYLEHLDAVIALKPGYVFHWGGVNDIGLGYDPLTGATAFWPRVKAAVLRMVSAGIVVVICGETGNSAWQSAAMTARLLRYNQLCRQLAAEYPGAVIYLDFLSVFAIQTTQYLTLSTTLVPDGVHPREEGAIALAAEVQRVMGNLFQPQSPPISYDMDSHANGGQWIADPLFVVDGGAAGSVITGDVPLRWTAECMAGITATTTLTGDEWKFEITATQSGQVVAYIGFTPAGNEPSYPAFGAGDTLVAGILASVETGSDNFLGVQLQLWSASPGVTYATDLYTDGSGTEHHGPETAYSLTLETPPKTLPSGVTLVMFQLLMQFSLPGGTAVVTVRRPYVRKVLVD